MLRKIFYGWPNNNMRKKAAIYFFPPTVFKNRPVLIMCLSFTALFFFIFPEE